jgi:hypothetical protein
MNGEYVKFFQSSMEIEIGEVDEMGEVVQSERYDAEDLLEELKC